MEILDYLWSMILLSPVISWIMAYLWWKSNDRKVGIVFTIALGLFTRGHWDRREYQLTETVQLQALTTKYVDCMRKAETDKAEELCMESYIWGGAGAIYDTHKQYLN